jgi:uncharacterized protein YeaO (DUF488 family)
MNARISVTYQVKRAYDPPEAADGKRVLVDRLWPRGLSKEHAELDAWAKDATPSAELRKWFHADREHRYKEFAERYDTELDGAKQEQAMAEVRELGRADSAAPDHIVTLVTSAKDVERSHVPVLLKRLEHGG